MYQISLVEHDAHLNHLFSLYLQKEGWTINAFLEADKACKYIDRNQHMWIIDSCQPDIDGFQLLNEIKEKYPTVPVILISDRNSGSDRVIALEMGCDDYMPKPFLPKELVLRSKRILERTYGNDLKVIKNVTYNIPPYFIDETMRIAHTDTNIIDLTAKEFELLLMFAKKPLMIFSRDQIIKYVWNEDHYGSDRSVDDLIRRLRKKMKVLRIESVYGYGYRLLPTFSQSREEAYKVAAL
jgi:Response regulators consisting of a CheY-like receiver domain and a winged-helix DNA-binding domain